MSEARLTAAIKGFRPEGLDLDGAALLIERRRSSSASPRTRRHRRWLAVGAAALVGGAAIGAPQFVAANRDEPQVTSDGTQLGQLSIAKLGDGMVWTVDVTRDGNDTCVTTAAGSVSGSVCSNTWGGLRDGPQTTFSRTPDEAEGPARTMVVIVSDPDETVGLTPRSYDTTPSDDAAVKVGAMDNVHKATVELSGRPRTIWSFLIDGAPEDSPPPVEAIYLD